MKPANTQVVVPVGLPLRLRGLTRKLTILNVVSATAVPFSVPVSLRVSGLKLSELARGGAVGLVVANVPSSAAMPESKTPSELTVQSDPGAQPLPAIPIVCPAM